jgi:hypothetical protein
MYNQLKEILCKSKSLTFTLTLLFMSIFFVNAQEIIREPLVIDEVDDVTFEEKYKFDYSFVGHFEMNLRQRLSPYLVNSICSESLMAFSFTFDSTYTIKNIQYTDSSAPLLQKEIAKEIAKFNNPIWVHLMVEESSVKLGSTYIIPISFYFKCTTGKTVSTFKRDYQSMDRFLKSFDWGKTEILDMIIIDLRYKK